MVAVAIILSGGKGERLRPLTDDRPKPMIQVRGRPILEHHVEWLSREGVRDVVFACGYHAEAIRAHFGDGRQFGVHALYSVETEPLGRGGALKQAANILPSSSDPIVATNGDTLTTQALRPLVDMHRRHGAVATVMVTRLVSPFGIAKLDRSNRIVGFIEKPRLPHWLNAGVYILSREFFERLPEQGDHEATTLPELASEGKLLALRSYSYWRTIDTAKDLSEIEREIRNLSPQQGWPPR